MLARVTLLLGVCTLVGATAFKLPEAYGQGPADLMYSPERFIHTPSLHPSFRLDPPAGPAAPQETDEAKADAPSGPITLRAGIVEEVIDEPGKIRAGQVTWSLAHSVTREPFVRGHVQIGNATALELTIARRHPTQGPISIVVTTAAGLGFEPVALSAPRLRRTAAAEGEPLFGRIQKRESNRFLFELSTDSVEAENNLERLLNRPWLDLIFRDKGGEEIVATLEVGRSGADLLRSAVR